MSPGARRPVPLLRVEGRPGDVRGPPAASRLAVGLRRSDVDPLRQLSSFLDLAILELPDFLLALNLAEELQLPNIIRIRRMMFSEGEAVFGRYLNSVRPGLTPDAARDLARLTLTLLVGSHEIGRGVEPDGTAMRDRIIRALRTELVPVAVDSARFDRVMAGH